MQLVERGPERLRARRVEAAEPDLESIGSIDLEGQQPARGRDEPAGAERLAELANDTFLIFDREAMQIVDDPHRRSLVEVCRCRGECISGKLGARGVQLA